MDEAALIVAELSEKLVQIDLKVAHMMAEFNSFKDQLLRHVPKDVSEEVTRSMADRIRKYSSSFPEVESQEFGGDGGSTSQVENAIADLGLPVPSLSATTTSPIATISLHPERATEAEIGLEQVGSLPRSPHARDKADFNGVILPSFLPLLDSNTQHERRSPIPILPTPPTPPPRTDRKGTQEAVYDMGIDASTDTKSLVNSPEASRPPTPKRRNTDEVSIKSNWSSDGENKPRRSALRRASTSCRDRESPRQVRFKIPEGEEVLPTSSPTPVGLEVMSSLNETDDEAGSEQIEDVEAESPPAPKRISSSQLLRQLSRSPLKDDGTLWTTVTAPPDGSASVVTTNGFHTDSSNVSLDMAGMDMYNGGSGANTPRAVPFSNMSHSSRGRNIGQGSKNTDAILEEAETPSDDEMLDIVPLRRQVKSPATMLSPVVPAEIQGNTYSTASTRSSGGLWSDYETLGNPQVKSKFNDLIFNDQDDQMFDFDENVPARKPQRLLEEDSDSEPEELLIKPRKSGSQTPTLSSYSKTPPKEIVRTTPASVPISKGVVGSFKGHPFSLPIVNPELHEQAKNWGQASSFVGSVHDPDGQKSFKGNFRGGSFTGTPRSLSERFQMEEYNDAAETKKKTRGKDS